MEENDFKRMVSYGYKVCDFYIVTLEIPEDAKFVGGPHRKCRCSKAKCVAIETMDGKPSHTLSVVSFYDPNFVYKIGETVEAKDFDPDETHICSGGIHFYNTRKEAEDLLRSIWTSISDILNNAILYG